MCAEGQGTQLYKNNVNCFSAIELIIDVRDSKTLQMDRATTRGPSRHRNQFNLLDF